MSRPAARKLSNAPRAYEHLSRETQGLAQADEATRADYIRRDRFIEHAGVQPVKARLLGLLSRPRTVRPNACCSRPNRGAERQRSCVTCSVFVRIARCARAGASFARSSTAMWNPRRRFAPCSAGF